MNNLWKKMVRTREETRHFDRGESSWRIIDSYGALLDRMR
jgi:hypothetical protein